MELRHLRYFLVAADEENFHRAAERLNVAQPALSQQIANLESELGFELFVRSRRRVHLSPAGRQYVVDAKQILHDIDVANENARRVAEGLEGTLRIGINETAARYSQTSIVLQRFRSANPSVKLRLKVMPSYDQVDALRTGEMDAGFAYVKGSVRPDLGCHELLTDDFVLAMSTTHRLAQRRTLKPVDLIDEDFIWVPKGTKSSHYDHLMGACLAQGVSLRIVHETASEATMLQLISVGLGLGFVPASARELHKEGVVTRPVEGLSDPVKFAVVWNNEDQSALLARFVSTLRELSAQKLI